MTFDLGSLNTEQKKAVTHTDGPLLIVAGAGTGKTTVITQRIAWLIEQKKALGHEILALTFTDKAAGEMEERVDRLLPYGYVDLWISTFHSFAQKILQLHALDIGVPNDFKLLTQTEQWLLVRQQLDRFKLDYYRPLGNPTKFIHALLKLFSRAKDEAITPQAYLTYVQDLKLNADSADFIKQLVDPAVLKTLSKKERRELAKQEVSRQEEIANAYHVYQQLLLDHNALDFGDLINYCLRLFAERSAVLARYRSQFKYLVVDEFQDTNHAQYELIKLLAAPRNNITVVGDDDQAIYKFRGASVSNILEFEKDYPKAKQVFLTANYRSVQPVLDRAYQFIVQNNPDRLEVKLQAAGSKLSKQLRAQTKEVGIVKHLHFETVDDEVAGVLKKCLELKEGDSALTWNDFAILARTNDAAHVFAHGLDLAGIPYRFVASRGLYTKSVVLDVLAYLRLLDNYHESQAVYRILTAPVVGLEPFELVQLTSWAKRKGYSLYGVLQQPEVQQQAEPALKEKIMRFLGLVEKHTQLAVTKPVSEVVMAFLQDSGYLDQLSAAATTEELQATSYLNQLYKKIIGFERASADRSTRTFLQLVDLELEAGESGALENNIDDGPEAVKVMTIHAAKGLEFDAVFIVNLVDRRFPIDDRGDPIALPDPLVKEVLPEGDAHLQEERRLMYVAMTRAKRNLFLTSAEDYGGQRRKKLSRFLVELQSQGLSLDETAQGGSQPLTATRPVVDVARLTRDDIEYLIPHRFSFTQLKAFERCPYHYWLEHILKIPQPGKPFFSFGSSLHMTLQQFFLEVQQRARFDQPALFAAKTKNAARPLVTLDELMNLYAHNWIDDWYGDRQQHDEYKQRGQDVLKTFYKHYEQELPIPKLLETPFSFHLSDPANGETYSIVGKIDRLDPLNSGVEIIDYKTGAGKTTETLDSESKQQLLIYQLAAEQQLNAKVEKLTYYYLETDRRASFVGTEKELKAQQARMIKTISEIMAWPFPATPEQCTCGSFNLRDR